MCAGIALATGLAHPDRVDGLVLWHPPYAGAAVGWSDGQRPIQQGALDLAQRILDGDASAAPTSTPSLAR